MIETPGTNVMSINFLTIIFCLSRRLVNSEQPGSSLNTITLNRHVWLSLKGEFVVRVGYSLISMFTYVYDQPTQGEDRFAIHKHHLFASFVHVLLSNCCLIVRTGCPKSTTMQRIHNLNISCFATLVLFTSGLRWRICLDTTNRLYNIA